MGRISLTAAFLGLSSLFAALTSAQDSTSNSTGAVFVYPNPDEDGEFVFALSADQDAASVSFHLSAPATDSWMAAGIGSQMSGSLMFVAYHAGNGKDMTVSPRIGSGNYEPAHSSDITCTTDAGSTNGNTDSGENVLMNAAVTCTGLKSWSGWSQLDFNSTAQPFIFAMGPDHGPYTDMWSDSLSASIPRHDIYGQFAMDMTAVARGDGVPAPNAANGSYVNSGAGPATGVTNDFDPGPAIHAFVMSLVWIILFPVGATLLRIMKRVLWHAACQTIGLVLFIMATAGGIKISFLYQKSRHFSSAHQVIGILLLIATLAQFALGLIGHRIYKKTQTPTIMGKIHRYMGPATMLLGLINGYVGFVFGGNRRLCLPYSILMLVVAIFLFAVRVCVKRRRNRQKGAAFAAAHGGGGGGGGDGYQYPQFGPGGQMPAGGPGQFGHGGYQGAGQYGAPDAPPPSYEHGVPLRAYRTESSSSVPMAGSQQPTQPRPMV